MARFRKKPVVIEAVQNTGEWRPIIEWMESLVDGPLVIPFGSKPAITRDPETGVLRIETLEGVMECGVGDWLIRGVKGEYYPCKPDIFEATYEPASS